MRPDHSLPPDYFEAMFLGDPDPWGLESRAYEAEKFARTVEALAGRTYRNGFEVGCAGGSLTHRLAPSCAKLLAIDVSETALKRARQRCSDQPQIGFQRMTFPQSTPALTDVDLIVLSEVAYYWSDADLMRTTEWMGGAMAPGGDILLVHWTGETDYPQTGDGAVQALEAALAERVEVKLSRREPQYRLDLWRMR